MALAAAKATHAAQIISFDGKQFRTDIAHKGIARYLIINIIIYIIIYIHIIYKKIKYINYVILLDLYYKMDN